MYNASDLRKGLKIQINKEPYLVVNFEFLKPGKGHSLYKCKLKNMLTGAQFDKTFRAGDKFEEPQLKKAELQFLYSDGTLYHFMNTENYEQEALSKEAVEEAIKFLKENTVCSVLFFNRKPIEITLPNFVELEVIETENWIKGDTATKDTKPALLETNYTINVPPFIEKGEKIKINTKTGEYIERVK